VLAATGAVVPLLLGIGPPSTWCNTDTGPRTAGES
jgi:hypothetical protein